MAVDEAKKKKILDNFSKHMEKGNVDRAIKEILKGIELDPDDVKMQLKLGDLHAKKGARKDAVEAYLGAAKTYEARGKLLEASAIYKQILKFDSSAVDCHVAFASLCAQMKLTAEAISHFHIGAQLLDAKGDAEGAQNLLKRITSLDPTDALARKRISELASRGGSGGAKDAVGELRTLAADLRRRGKREELCKVLEKMGHLDPENVDVMRELAGIYLQSGDAKKGLARLQVCYRADPADLRTLELLVRIFESLGQPTKARAVNQEIARLRATG